MSWWLEESFVQGKRSDLDCEDGIVVTDDYVAVIDGATDETGASFGGRSGGRFAAEVIASEIRRTAAEANPRQFADRLTDALAAAVASEAGPLSPETRWPVASVVCLALAARQVWRIGDCHILIDETAHPATKRVDDASYGFRAVINSALLAKGLPLDRVLAEDPGAEASRPLYDLQQHLANTLGPWGYGCINGSRIQDQHIEVFNVPEGRHQVVLATDGYPDVQPTLAASEQRLAELMQTDPAAVGPLWRMGKPLRPGYGAMDDRAYVRVTVE